MRVLVTGGAGFVGSHVVDLLIDSGHEVRVLDSLTAAAHHDRPDYLNPAADYVFADLVDEQAVQQAVAGMEAICHQGARVGLGVDFDDVTSYVTDNALGTAFLLRALHRRRFEGRIVLASSMVVYGEGGYACASHGRVRPPPRRSADLAIGVFEPLCPTCGEALEPVSVGEDEPLDPRNVYAATKVHQEQLCQAYAIAASADVVSLRYHNVYGPRMPRDTPYAGVASIVRSAYEAGRAPSIFEDGRQRRDFVHVRDVARANLAALTAEGEVSGAYNVASGRVSTIEEMALALRAGFEGDAPAPQVTGEFRLGDVRHINASPARARERLGFAASVGFEEGMREFATDPLRAMGAARAS